MAVEHSGGARHSRKDRKLTPEQLERQANRILRDAAKANPNFTIYTKTCTIYFIQIGDDGPIKIGRTDGCPTRRLSDLQTAIPYELRVVATINSAPLAMESALHREFSHLHMRGEWFRPEPDLLAMIRERAQHWRAEDVPAKRKGGRRRDIDLIMEALEELPFDERF